ncbi:MDR family MFS transporter [Paenisporosarcina cavernae]|uniref:DHA2 family efflux MFS transporter permease subunit n=1 Tax=Paenisporosarcina cavernae TaxID=2320858 RepID=A0A385YSG6_9BACL|nr:MDR family MFS transporter [Paenisporosarcina cavernae]AYC28618.1 DHA2 family efflux MFS transporter permease subunit [Paenisporosarcina cavernae]
MQQPRVKLVLSGLLLAILMAAMDNTIVATALGSILADLGGVENYIWITSAYAVAVLAGMPIFGKLSDMYGRKRFFVFGLALFLIGSALCGIADTIPQLAAYRAIQGIGGGALMPIAFTIVFDIFPPEQRGKMTGLFGAVFGASSILGPLLGAFITDTFSWNWVFYVNIPLGIVSLVLVWLYYHESTEHSKQKIDWLGSISLVTAVVSLMFALELGGKEYEWTSWIILGLFAVFAVFLIVFFFAEKRAAEPIISFWMFKSKLFASSQVLAFVYGATFVGLTIFIPLFVQSVYGGSATNAGIILMPMLLGSVVGSAFAGIMQTKWAYRKIMAVSVVVYAIGMVLMSTISPETDRLLLTVYMTLVGIGVGFSFSLLPSASVHKMDFRHRGSANSTNAFFRSLGLAIGITVFGAIQTKLLQNQLDKDLGNAGGGSFSPDNLQNVFEPAQRNLIPPNILEKIIDAMAVSISSTFFWSLIPIAIAAIAVYTMGNERLLTEKKSDAPAEGVTE